MKTTQRRTIAQTTPARRQIGAWTRLSYSQKFTIITLIFVLPLLAFSPLIYEQVLRIDRYGLKEADGTIYLRGLWQLNNSLHKYYIATSSFENGLSTSEQVEDARSQVAKDLQALGTIEDSIQDIGLRFTVEDLQSRWDGVQSNEDVFSLLDEVDVATREVGDKSYLILDPDLDTYYLMDSVLLKLPEIQGLLFETQTLLNQAATSKQISDIEKNELKNLLKEIQLDLVEVSRNLTVAESNNINAAFDASMMGAYEEYLSEVSIYSRTLQLHFIDNQFSIKEFQALNGQYDKVLATGSNFYSAASISLEKGIQNRIQAVGSRLIIYVLISILSILLAFFIGNQLMKSISTPLSKVIQAAELLSSGDLSTRVDYRSDDEAGKVIQAFNQLANEVEENQYKLERRNDDLGDKTRKLETIAKVARQITSIRDLSIVLTTATNLVHENFGYYHVGIFLLDERKEYAILSATNSAGGRRMLERGHQLKIGETGIVGYVAEALQARIALDVGEDAHFFNNPDLPETRSEMALPLVVSGQILGVLDVQSTESSAFVEDDIATLQILAEQLAIAIQNANLFSEKERALESARSTYGQISREAWGTILRSQSRVGFIATPGTTMQTQSEKPEASIARAIDTGDLILGSDGLTISVPVKIRGQVIGAIRLKKAEIAEAWTQDETNLAISLSDQLSGALESARLYRESQQRAARESLVSDISARINASTTMDSIIRETVQELGQAIGNTSVTFQLVHQPHGANQAESAERGARTSSDE